jgi:hypothetical protein
LGLFASGACGGSWAGGTTGRTFGQERLERNGLSVWPPKRRLVRSRTKETIDAPCYPSPALYESRATFFTTQIVDIGSE